MVTLNIYSHLLKDSNQEAACRLGNAIFEVNGSRLRKRGHGRNRNPLIFMVGGTGFEPVTSTV
jgi:hypothetical protein